MNGKQLRDSILQWAIQGHLVPQNPADEPAIELLRRIQEEKAKIIKEEKTKKGEKESLIFRGNGNKYYGQKGKNATCIDEKIPFEIPDSWEWCKFGQIVDFRVGKTPPRGETYYWANGFYNWASISDMAEYGRINTTKEKISANSKKLMGDLSPIGTLIMSFKLTVGRTSILEMPSYHNEAIIAIYPYIDENYVLRNYLFYILPLVSKFGKSKEAIKGKTLNSASIAELLIPLPPLAEQKRIVEKIDELMPLVDQYEKSKLELDKLNSALKDKLRASILKEAIAGHLVPQNPADEPAIELLKRINPKFTPPEYDNPLPQGWSVATLSTITTLANGVKIQNKEMVNLDAEFLRGQAKGTIRNEGKFVPANSLVILVDGENSGEVFRTPIDGYQGSTFKILTIDPNMYEMFVQKVIDSHRTKLRAHKVGSAKPHLNKKLFYETIILIPPLAEQKRIVEKIEKLFAVLDSMEVAQTSQGQDSNA